MTRIDEIKKLIRTKEIEINRLTEEYEKNYFEIKKVIDTLKIEFADIVLESEADDCKTYTMVSVEFKEGGKTYDYLWNNKEPVAIGDTVEVENKWGDIRQVTVKNVFKINAVDVEFAEMDYKNAYPIN